MVQPTNGTIHDLSRSSKSECSVIIRFSACPHDRRSANSFLTHLDYAHVTSHLHVVAVPREVPLMPLGQSWVLPLCASRDSFAPVPC